MTPLTLEASRSVTIYVAELAHIAVAWVLEMSFPYLMEKGCSIDILNEDGITSIRRVCFGDFFSIFDGERLFKWNFARGWYNFNSSSLLHRRILKCNKFLQVMHSMNSTLMANVHLAFVQPGEQKWHLFKTFTDRLPWYFLL